MRRLSIALVTRSIVVPGRIRFRSHDNIQSGLIQTLGLCAVS